MTDLATTSHAESPGPSPIGVDVPGASLATAPQSSTRGMQSPEFWQAMRSATAAIGTEDFYDRLLEVLGTLVDHDLLALVRYSSFGAPDLVIPRENRNDIEIPYNSGLYALDPFFHYWQAVSSPSVATLHQLATAEMWESQYARQVLSAARINDEMAIFLPPIGGASPTLMLDRADGCFTEDELSRVRDAFPLVAGLHEAHIKAITSRGVDRQAEEKPRRIVDRCGRELTANAAWRRLQMELGSELAAAVAIADAGNVQVNLPGGRMLTRSHLASDFGAAPEGICDEVAIAPLNTTPSPFGWLERLTPREKQIVLLTLEGHPIAGIARRLGLSSGTVKNHRLRLYQKLDITTERELFLTHMQHMQAMAA